MVNIIHYEDDMFYLAYTVKRLSDGLKLDLDPSLFLGQIRIDIAFLSQSLAFFLDSLKNTQLKVNRLNHLKNVFQVNKLFIELLNFILTEQSPFSQHLREYFPNLADLRIQHTEYEHEIRDALKTSKKAVNQDHEALSEEEYRDLLSPDEDS